MGAAGGAAQPSVDPDPILESDSELFGDFFGGRLGSPLEFILAARFPINFQPSDDNQAYRIAGSDHHGGPHDPPRGFAPRRAKRARSKFAPALGRHRISFDDRIHLGGSIAESDDETLDCAAT